MLSVRAVYDTKKGLKFFEKLNIKSPKEVIITFLDPVEEEEYPAQPIGDSDIQGAEIHEMLQAGGALDFLEDEAEDIYSDNDLRKKY